MADGYSGHKDYLDWVKDDTDQRNQEIDTTLRAAFQYHIETREVEVVVFSSMTVFDLADALFKHPIILKPLLACANIAGRAIDRDLGIKNLDTYSPNLDKDKAQAIAGYLKPFLPNYLEIPTISFLDRVQYIDKEIRKAKGNWEKKILNALNKLSGISFKKRHFEVDREKFEIDAASPTTGDIEIAIDVKRIEAKRDIHKRCDEIVNKSQKFKKAYRNSKFFTFIYYPFIEEHTNVKSRLNTKTIDAIVFATESQDSVNSATRFLIATF